MGSLNITNEGVYFVASDSTQKVLLNFNEYLKNKGRIPMHSLEGECYTIFDFLSKLYNSNIMLFGEGTFEVLQNITVVSLVISKLIQSSAAVKVIEFGSTKGKVSYNLAEVLSKFNPESLLCLVSNVIGNESGNRCLDYISLVSKLPQLSMVYSDYNKTVLGENTFDIVVINGCEKFEEPYAVIKEAERVCKKDGMILCITNGDCLLHSAFQLVFSERTEYDFSVTDVILVAQKNNTWDNITYKTIDTEQEKLCTELKGKISLNTETDELRCAVSKINNLIVRTISEEQIKTKLYLMEVKECILDCINTVGTEYRSFYQEKLEKLLAIKE